MLMPAALLSEACPRSGTIWRIVEAQSRISTLRLTNSLLEQQILEEEIEAAKPPLPPGTEHLDPLLRTPFRYEPYPAGSRFRRAHQREGVYYGAEAVETAMAELAFYRLLFLAEAPGMRLPDRPLEFTAFSVNYAATALLDLTLPTTYSTQWTDPVDYTACHDLADAARAADIQALRYQSVRDPLKRANVALLTWTVFRVHQPQHLQTWHLYLRPTGADAVREFPKLSLTFTQSDFASDGRLTPFFAAF